jgi:hypothetical protein
VPFTIPNEASAAFAEQAEVDQGDIAILVAGHAGTGVVSGCEVTAQGSPNMTVAVAAGTVAVSGAAATVGAGNVTIDAADGANPRFDLVVVGSAGNKSVVKGTASSNPVFPAIPANSVVLAAIYVPASDTAINTNQIVDKRVVLVPGVPAGTISPFAGSSAPAGWLLCEGQAVSRTTYAVLFAAISTAYGVGDGATTFNVPNLKKRFPIGLDAATPAVDTLGETGGQFDATINPAPATSGGPSSTTTADQGGDAGQPIGPVASSTHTHDTDLPALTVPNPPYLVVNYIIKT